MFTLRCSDGSTSGAWAPVCARGRSTAPSCGPAARCAWRPGAGPAPRRADSTSPRSVYGYLFSSCVGVVIQIFSYSQVKVRYQRLPDGEEEKDIMIV